MRQIKPGTKLVQDFVPQQPQLPTNLPVIQYIRQSTTTQVKHNKQSTILQDVKLTSRLVAYGWKDTPETIIKIATDQGKSGQKLRFQREGLDHLYRLIESGKAGAVAAYDASRLYRDLTRTGYTDFVAMCEKYHIPVITFDTIYWPDKRQDMDKLIDKFAEAARFIDEVIHGKLIPAKLQAIEDAQSYGGHCVPFGFTVVETEERKYYAVYEPHAKLIRWLFKRYQELGGNLGKLGRELAATGFQFPAFTGVETIPHVALKWNGQGYPLQSRGGIISILTNPAYIGWYVFSGVVVSKQAHDAIVDMDDFMYAYSRLSAYTLTGEENEDKPKIDRRYGVACDALLENILESDGKPVYVMAHTQAYSASTSNNGWHTTELVVSVARVDSAVEQALDYLRAIIQTTDLLGITEGLEAELTALLTEKEASVKSLDKDRGNILRAIQQAELDKRVAKEELYEQGVREATRDLKRLHEALAALDEKARSITQETNELAEIQGGLGEILTNRWHKLPFTRKKRFMRLLVVQANITCVTQHIIRLDLNLRAPISRTLTGYLFRNKGTKKDWTPEENAILTRLYPQADRRDLLEALPMRSWSSIMHRSDIEGVQRAVHLNSANIPDSLSFEDFTLMQEIGMSSEKQVVWNDSPIRDLTVELADRVIELVERIEQGLEQPERLLDRVVPNYHTQAIPSGNTTSLYSKQVSKP